MELNTTYVGDALKVLKTIPSGYINCVVTSPPYFGLRNYQVDGQVGLEETPEKYIRKLVKIFSEVRRVLKEDGTMWINIGDSYAGYWGDKKAKAEGRPSLADKNGFSINSRPSFKSAFGKSDVKSKDLIGIPWMLAFALRKSGYYLRQDVIWSKPNPMPESVTDRCTKSHEYIFLFSKSPKYYYDNVSIMTDISEVSYNRLNQDIENQKGSSRVPGKTNGAMKARASWNGSSFDKGKIGEMKETHGHTRKSGNKERKKGSDRGCPEGTGSNVCGSVPWEGLKANKRSVWTVTTKPFKGNHFAVFPQDLIVDCIKAGCPEGGVVLDPFHGAGTTGIVATKLNRNFIGIELNPDYVKLEQKRRRDELGFFA